MRISEFLLEYRDADLYHGTNLSNAEDVLKTDLLRATSPITLGRSMTVKGDHGLGWQRIVSFSRSLSVASAFAQNKSLDIGPKLTGAVLVFDQASIRRDYGRRLQAYNDLTHVSRKSTTEQEEALIGDLKNVSKYLKKIYVFFTDQEQLEKLRDTYEPVLTHPKTVVVMGKQRKPRVDNRLQAFPTHREIER